MSLLDLAQYGGMVLMAGILYKVVRSFLCAQKKRDEQFLGFITKQEDNFNDIVKNHLHADTEAKKELEKSHLRLAMMIENLLKWLEKNNH